MRFGNSFSAIKGASERDAFLKSINMWWPLLFTLIWPFYKQWANDHHDQLYILLKEWTVSLVTTIIQALKSAVATIYMSLQRERQLDEEEALIRQYVTPEAKATTAAAGSAYAYNPHNSYKVDNMAIKSEHHRGTPTLAQNQDPPSGPLQCGTLCSGSSMTDSSYAKHTRPSTTCNHHRDPKQASSQISLNLAVADA